MVSSESWVKANGLGTLLRPEAARLPTNREPTNEQIYFRPFPFPFAAGAAGFAVASVNAMFWPT